jgi:hypothetical protein
LIETAMRVLGATALIIGFLLCVSIAWAAIGFFAMGFGLIFLLIAEEREKASALRSESSEIEPSTTGPPQPMTAAISTANIQREIALRDVGKWSEMDKWSCLVANDEDLSRLVKILEPFGQKYVDQLAGAYIVFDDKAYLPTILNLIVASARKDAGLSAADIRKLPSATAADMLFENEKALQQEALDEGSEKIAIVEDLTDATVRPSATLPVPREKAPDELDNLRGLFDRLGLAPSKRQ